MNNNEYKNTKLGVWFMGALGDIATTAITGALAADKGLTSKTGLLTELAPFSELELVQTEQLVFGGFDISSKTLNQSVESLYNKSRTISREILDAIYPEITKINQDIHRSKNYAWSINKQDADLPELGTITSTLRQALTEFKTKHNLSHVVVVNLSSVEPMPPMSSEYNKLDSFIKLVSDDRKDLVSPSMICTYVAFLEKCSYVNFTPNIDIALGCLQELAQSQKVNYCGNDGKTGETLVKTALAPMFLCRNLEVMSWEGTNMLGNNDGLSLSDPDNRASKISNKQNVLHNILGYPVHSGVHIDYVPSLGDWKTAWDFIHFKGFLDVTMTMQFTWQGCDSILAAPLVLDLVRFSEYAYRNQEAGPMQHLSSYFKNPLGVEPMALYKQFEDLLSYAKKHLPATSEVDNVAHIKSTS